MFTRGRWWAIALFLGAGACSGSFSCSSCAGAPLSPIPGGFEPAARLPRAAQVRVTRGGLDFIEARFSDLVNAYARMSCGAPEDPPCPSGLGAQCDPVGQICTDAAGTPQPVVGFAIDYTAQGDATVCRDDPTDPNRRDCFGWLRLEGLALAPEAPNRVRATVTARVLTSAIPIRYANSILDLDCLVTLDSARSGGPLQDMEVVLELATWGGPDGPLRVNVAEVTAQIPDDDLDVRGDPVEGGAGDALACGGLNALGFLKRALISRLTERLGGIVEDELDEALGRTCGVGDPPCPAGASCNADAFCEVAERVIPAELGVEGRLDLASLLGDLGGGPADTDLAFRVGGEARADGAGVNVGALGGAERVTLDGTCAQDLPSPRLRPSYAPPAELPRDGRVDLDWDGTSETPYMVAAGLSEALLDQAMWSLYSSGLFCQRIGAEDVELLNTGSLGLLLPSLEQLTHADRYPWAVYPAALTLTPAAEPVIRIGSGEVDTGAASPQLIEPLVEVVLDDVRVDFYALLEERWVRLLTVQADLTLGFGATVNPMNEVELVLGDLANALTDVRVANSEILLETPEEIADAIPALIQLALPQLTGAIPPIALPGPSSLGGFDLQVLGIRGVEGRTAGLYDNLAVYGDLDFFPGQVGNLSFAADTAAEVVRLEVPPPERLSAPGGAAPSAVVLALGGEGGPLEHQVRVDGGPWSPFFTAEQVRLEQASLSIPGRHAIEVRARVAGAYRTLDPTPARLEVVVDPEPPRADVRVLPTQDGLSIRAADRVSRDRLDVAVVVDGVRRPAATGRVEVPELLDPQVGVSVVVTDEQGLEARVVVREPGGPVQVPEAAAAGGCRCAPGSTAGSGALVLLALFALRRRR